MTEGIGGMEREGDNILLSVLEAAATVYKEALAGHLSSGSALHFRPRPLPSQDHVEAVANALSSVPDLQRLSRAHQYGFTKRTHTALSPQIVARGLITRAADVAAAQAVLDLRDIVAANRATASIWAMVSGIWTSEEADLGANITIRPFDFDLMPTAAISAQRPVPGLIVDHTIPEPTAFLILKVSYAPVFDANEIAVDPWPAEDVKRLIDMADWLAVATGHGVVIMEMWINHDDPRLPTDGGTIFFRDHKWGGGQLSQPAEVTEDVLDFARRLGNVKVPEERKAIELAASRFNRSCRAASS